MSVTHGKRQQPAIASPKGGEWRKCDIRPLSGTRGRYYIPATGYTRGYLYLPASRTLQVNIGTYVLFLLVSPVPA
ncbi:MAG: hypothetical protein LBQ60_09615 [Bacteroidales bacterium]|nr:hypothetical protein [Bacteroidales bacterium]